MPEIRYGARRNAFLGLVGLNLLFVGGLPFFANGSWAAHAWSDSFWIVASVAAAIPIGKTWRRQTSFGARRGWLLLFIAVLFWLLGIILWTWEELVLLRYSPSPGINDVGPVCFGILSVPAVVHLMRPVRREKITAVEAVELGISIGILLLTIGILFYVPVSELGGSSARLIAPGINTLTYSTSLMLGIFFLAQGRPKTSWPAAICVLLGIAVQGAAHFAYFYAFILGKYEAGQLMDVLWVLSLGLLGFAAVEERNAPESSARPFLSRERARLASAVYWGFFMACLAIGLWSYHEFVPRSYFVTLTFGFFITLLIIVYLEMNWRREVALRKNVEDALRVRDEFLAIASHELKTPLTPLAGNLFLLETLDREGKLASFDPIVRTETIRSARRQVDYLYRLIEGLLSARRITDGTLELRASKTDLVEIVRRVAARNGDELARANCELRLELPESAPGEWDELRIEQVVANLLANAIKFGRGKPVALAVHAETKGYRLVVEDKGIGIDPRDHAKIFEQFGRAAQRGNYAGFGLGLFVARQVALAHGATLEVQSRLGEGARFVLHLPPQVGQ